MELRTLNKRHAFGIKADVYSCLHWLDDHTLTYPVGRNVVIHNVNSNAQKFFLTSERTDAITAISLSPTKKFLVVAESGERPHIQTIDTNTRKRKKVFTMPDDVGDRIVAIAWSADGRNFITQFGAPTWKLVYWNSDKSGKLGETTVQPSQAGGAGPSRDPRDNRVTCISVNPKVPTQFAVSGPSGLFRFYKHDHDAKNAGGNLPTIKPVDMAGGQLKSQTFNFTTHCWVTPERIVVATDSGDLLYFEEGEFRGHLASAPSDQNHAITAIEPTSRGFVCGSDAGAIFVFEAVDDKDIYRRIKMLTIDSKDVPDEIAKPSVRAFALTHGEDMLAVATSTMQVYGVKFSHEWSRTEAPAFQAICQPFHAGEIVDLDTCVRKPLVATASKDRTVRVWNVQEHTVEVIKHFNAEPQAIAMHPSGLHILVCLPDRVRFMNLYGDTIHEFRTFAVRSATIAKFSVGGQYFALVQGTNIFVYNTYTCDQICALRANNQKIRAIQWGASTQYPLDTRILACTAEGMVMDCTIKDMHREESHSDKKFRYDALAADDRHIWVVGAPSSRDADSKFRVKLREIEHEKKSADSATDYEFPELELKTLALASQHRILFGGAADGSIKLMTFPLQGGIHDPPILAHAGQVMAIAVSHDESMFFSVGKDGSFYIFDIKEDGRTAKREMVYADEILISRGDLDEKAATRASLNHMVQELEHDMEYSDKRRLTQHNEKMKDQQNTFQEEADKQAQQFAAVWNAKLDQEREFADIKREKAEEHANECSAAEERHDRRLRELKNECAAAKREMEGTKEAFAADMKKAKEDAAHRRAEAEARFSEKLQDKQATIHRLEEGVNRDSKTQGEMRSQLEMDTDTEIENVNRKYANALHRERETYLHMKGENAIFKKAFTQYQKEKENREAEVHALDAMKEALLQKIRKNQNEIQDLTSKIDEQDQTIAEREKKIYELKKKNQELEKHKFVLDHKIRQLKSQIEPRQMQIAKEKEKIQAKDQELEQLHKNNLTLRNNIAELQQKIGHGQEEIKQLLNRLKDFETYRGRVRTDIGELAQLVQDPAALKTGIDKVFHDHVVARGGKRTAPLAGELKSEFNTHTEYLARTVESLKRKVSEDHVAHRGEVSSVMKDNLGLIKEINELRREIARLKLGDGPGAATTTGGPGATSGAASTFASTGGPSASHLDAAAQQAAAAKEIEANRQEMQKLKLKIEELEKSIQIRSQPRPGSRDAGKLPPLTGTH